MTSLVSDLMTDNVIAVRRDAEFKEIVEVMRRRKVSAFPVLDLGDRVIGVVSEADLLVKAAYLPRPAVSRREGRRWVPAKAEALLAVELMTSPAVTIPANATVSEAARVMNSHHVKRLPVVDDADRLVGIVSRVDLLGVYDRPDVEIGREIIERVLAGDLVLDPTAFLVEVRNGIVTITGKVSGQEAALRLIEAVWDVTGVVDVRDRLRYRKPASQPVADDLAEELNAAAEELTAVAEELGVGDA